MPYQNVNRHANGVTNNNLRPVTQPLQLSHLHSLQNKVSLPITSVLTSPPHPFHPIFPTTDQPPNTPTHLLILPQLHPIHIPPSPTYSLPTPAPENRLVLSISHKRIHAYMPLGPTIHFRHSNLSIDPPQSFYPLSPPLLFDPFSQTLNPLASQATRKPNLFLSQPSQAKPQTLKAPNRVPAATLVVGRE